MLDFISDFMHAYPRIKIDLLISNEFIDLVAQNIDMGIRFGDLADSTLVAKKLGMTVRYLGATPGYLSERQIPVTPEDLKLHQCVLMNGKNGEAQWHLGKRAQENLAARLRLRIEPRLQLGELLYPSRGHAIGLLPFNYCDDLIDTGELVRILLEWTSPKTPAHALYATRKFIPAKLRVFLDALQEWNSPFCLPK